MDLLWTVADILAGDTAIWSQLVHGHGFRRRDTAKAQVRQEAGIDP